jgi:hypothetical protein
MLEVERRGSLFPWSGNVMLIGERLVREFFIL